MLLLRSQSSLVLMVTLSFLLFAEAARADNKLLGTKPPEWQVTDWIQSQPLTLQELAGKVVLVRWWMAPGCSYCAATAPALNEFHATYKDQGLVVLGFYHHKAAPPLKLATVQRAVA